MHVSHWFLASVLALGVLLGAPRMLLAEDDPAAGEATEAEVFAVEGMFTVGVPAGYEWKLVDEGQGGGVATSIYNCSEEGSTAEIAIVVQGLEAGEDEQRIIMLEAYWTGMVGGLKAGGEYELTAMEEPGIEAPIPDKVDFWIDAVSSEGEAHALRARTVFGERTYLLVAKGSPEEAEELAEVFDTLSELPVDY